jgi:hypothetical protein
VSSRYGRLREVFPVSPGCGLVVAGSGFQASGQDADQPVGQPPEGVVMVESVGPLSVVEGAGAGRGSHAGLRQGDLSVRVPAKMVLHLPLQGLDLFVQRGDQRDQGPGRARVGGRQGLGPALAPSRAVPA